MKKNKETGDRECPHCRGLIEIRMPVPSSGCDHLYYPDCCKVCSAISKVGNMESQSNSKEAKKAALLDKIMPLVRDEANACPCLSFSSYRRCLICESVAEYDAIEKDGKP